MDSLILEAVAVAMAHRGTCVQHVTSGVSPEYMGSRFSEPGPSLAVGGGGDGWTGARSGGTLTWLLLWLPVHCRGLTWH